MHSLEVRLLGPSIVLKIDELVSIQRRIPRALLFYLAAKGNLVHRDTILDLFWDAGAQINRQRLSVNLSRLRSSLPDSDMIISYDDLVGLNFDKVYVDLVHFQDLLDQAGRTPWQIAEDKPLPSHLSQLLNQANDLWRGPYALQGIKLPTPSLDNWSQITAEHLHNSRYNILTRLADHFYVMQSLPTALAFARAALRYDNFSESLHFKIMNYLVKMDQIDEALQFFEETRKLMMDEIDAHPSPQMIKLYQHIRNSEYTSTPEIEPLWEVHPSLNVPFVGRQDSMIAINRAIINNQGIIILGESGQGKTRLMQEFIAELHPQPRVLISNCRPTESSLPFHPIVEVLRRHVTPDEWLALSSVWASHLTELLPELVELREDLELRHKPEKSDLSQAMIFESIRQIFLLLDQNRPIFFAIDDAHWADKATLSTISYLLTREPFSSSSSLVIITRLEDISDSLLLMLNSFQESKHATIYKLKNLRRESITNLTQHFLEIEPSDQFIDRLFADTGGNTFFVLEILRAILETGNRTVNLETELPITENLQSLLISRVQKLSQKAKGTLEIAAIIGPEFSIQILGLSCHQSPDEFASILLELEGNLLVKPSLKHREELFYQFTHEKIRETLISRIQPAHAQILHGQVANALSLRRKSEAGILAHHYSGAGELKIAFQYWIRAAKRARSLFAKEDASRNYAHAEELICHFESEMSDDDIYDFYAEWSDLAYNINQTELLVNIGNKLIHIGETRIASMLIGSGFNILSNASFAVNEFGSGLAHATQAIHYLEHSENNFEHIEAYNHLGASLYMLNRLDEAVMTFQDALALRTYKPDSKLYKALSNSHYQIALLQTLKGTPNSGYTHGEKAFEFAELSQHSYSIVQAYAIQALAQFYMGNFANARDISLTGIQLAQRTQGWRMLGYLHSYAAMAEVALGYLDSGRKHAEEAIQLGNNFGHNDVAALGYRQLGELHRLLYDYSTAASYHQQGIDAIGEHFIGLDNLYRLGLVQHYLGQPRGLEKINLARILLAKNTVGIGEIAAKTCQALVSESRNQWSETRQLATELETETLVGGLASYHITAILLLAEAAFAENDEETAFEHFQFTAGEAQFLKNLWLELKALSGIRRIRRNQDLDAAKPCKRFNEILDQLESNITHTDTRRAYTIFRQKIANSNNINTITL